MENDCRNSAECPEGQLLEKTLIILRKKKKNKYLCPGGPRYRKLPMAFITS